MSGQSFSLNSDRSWFHGLEVKPSTVLNVFFCNDTVYPQKLKDAFTRQGLGTEQQQTYLQLKKIPLSERLLQL